jgi:hypothetical protein
MRHMHSTSTKWLRHSTPAACSLARGCCQGLDGVSRHHVVYHRELAALCLAPKVHAAGYIQSCSMHTWRSEPDVRYVRGARWLSSSIVALWHAEILAAQVTLYAPHSGC